MNSEVEPKETQVIAELYDVEDREILDSPSLMEEMLRRLAEEVGEESVHVHVHEFEPYGVSGFLMMRKGYVAIHTWPEHSYATVNVVGFSDETWAWNVYKALVKLFKPKQQNAVEVKSGLDRS
ncbi:MAG: adenosylmethionine decarboxylase [Candidatus Korarchaeota archaeon]|nr:adenosylmethionine decarboxylase [Candidatus Korarchaeota archaeon]